MTTLNTTTVDITGLQPLHNYVYFIEKMGIDGNCGWMLEFPKGQTHGSPRGVQEYRYFMDGHRQDPYYFPFIITEPNYPSWQVYNPTTATNNSDAYFFGEKWLVEPITDPAMYPPEGKYTEFLDFNETTQGMGQG